MNARQLETQAESWRYPRLARIYWKCPCERCVADEIWDASDTSEGLPAYVDIRCPDCERELRFHIRWTMPEIHSVQLVEIHDPFFPDEAPKKKANLLSDAVKPDVDLSKPNKYKGPPRLRD